MDERTAELDGHLVFWREAPSEGTPILWVHGVPESSLMWRPFMEAAGGIALDLPGFGRSGKRADFPYGIDGYVAFIEAFCDHLELERVRLVCHDWGVVGLAWATRYPERVERLVAIDTVPLDSSYRWHFWARMWRRRMAGEATMGATTGWAVRRVTGMPKSWSREVMPFFDHGTQRAILRLYRSADPGVLGAAGEGLGVLGAPALVVWGERDPFIPVSFAERLASTLPRAEREVVSGAGHWPWLDQPEEIGRILRFLAG